MTIRPLPTTDYSLLLPLNTRSSFRCYTRVTLESDRLSIAIGYLYDETIDTDCLFLLLYVLYNMISERNDYFSKNKSLSRRKLDDFILHRPSESNIHGFRFRNGLLLYNKYFVPSIFHGRENLTKLRLSVRLLSFVRL